MKMFETNKPSEFMRFAIELGLKVKGLTGDNPYVGAVVVKGETIVGQGSTQPPGQGHAEVMAIQDAESKGIPVEGSTIYSTVEPCSFFGRTPSCAELLVKKKFARVIIGIRDPHPKVNGLGIEILRRSGIVVDEGICADEVRAYLAGWLKGFES